jgi:hypothetical protein
MRIALVAATALCVFGFSAAASAEPLTGVALAPAPSSLSLQLADGRWSPTRTQLDLTLQVARSSSTEEPGEALTAVVERMWSQVRAYKRPGGAEVFVRGRF